MKSDEIQSSLVQNGADNVGVYNLLNNTKKYMWTALH
jgi:hypothetical protein